MTKIVSIMLILRFHIGHDFQLLNKSDTFVHFVEGDSEHSSSQMVKNATSQLTCKICWVQCSAAMTQCPVCRTRAAGTIKVNI